ncbi:NAD(P)H:quinone oxidoreductase [Alteromonas confluentis]|uniref:NAD(P)H:quinone oxidoreductase, type IV n=1 Tax=Alteromonas confluentis TaxID=1656094 RepID=A0A1E7Z556_9ALTE|nr:NAD(P)H:quinone oxidoreductase [Alteromonas confluentis]OFC68679.1 NAD(P)H:quinone oxidoreductase, type IV [Alteromonas confluentis]
MTKILVLYYSRNGSTKLLANQIAKGVESTGAEAMLRTVPPIPDYLSTQPAVPESGAPFVSQQDLSNCDGLALGSPTRFGNMAAPLKHFLDSTSQAWLKGTLINKPGCVFTSTGSMHGGQETTLLTMMLPLLHHGMVLCGLPYSEAALHDTETGGSPYGATHVATNHQQALSEHEKQLAFAQGKRLALLANQLKGS